MGHKSLKDRVMYRRIFICLIVLLGLITGTASATLYDRGNGFIYSDIIDVTFTQSACLYCIDTGGQGKSFPDAALWVEQLQIGGFNDWRLPTPTATETNELAQLFYEEFGGSGGQPYYETPNVEAWSLFSDIQDWYWYNWSGVLGVPVTTSAYTFSFNPGGSVRLAAANTLNSVWAIRDGDVATVPEPATIILMGLGLVGLGFSRRHKVKSQSFRAKSDMKPFS